MEKQRIIEFVVKDGLKRFKTQIAGDSILNNCAVQKKDDNEILIFSTDNIKTEFVPPVKGYQFDFRSPEEIKSEYQTDHWICFFAINQFTILPGKIRINLAKSRRRINYIYQESFFYEFKEVRGKWRGRYVRSYSLES